MNASSSTSSISAVARLRPLLDREILESDGSLALAVEDDNRTINLLNTNKSGGRFSRCFKMKAAMNDVSQKECFDNVLPMLEGAIEGYNTSILAYGQTGTGKTKTMVRVCIEMRVCICPPVSLSLSLSH